MRRSRWRLAILGTVLLVSGLGASRGASAAPNLAAQIEDAIRFRETFGLRADAAFVAAIAADPAYDSAEFGVPLSSAEIADLEARATVREAFTPALVNAIDSPGYAGAYVDQLQHGQPVILTTDPQALNLALGSVQKSAAVAEIKVVRYSLAELTDLKATVAAASKDLAAQGIDLVSVGFDIAANRILVGVEGLTDAISADLKARFGDGIVLREDRPSEFDTCTVVTCWPMKGGLRIQLVSDPSHFYCTSGFMVRKSDSGALSLLTAGHCIALGNTSGSQDYWGHNSSPSTAVNIGYEAPYGSSSGYHTWFAGSNGDVALVVLDTESVAALNTSTLNLLHIADPDSATSTVTSVKPASQQLFGDSVCRMGYGTYLATGQGVTCGTIAVPDIDHKSCNSSGSICYTIHHTWEVNFDSVGGDSGGPVFHQIAPPNLNYSAYGTHVHSWVTGDPLPKHGWYTPISYGQSQYQAVAGFNYTVCVTGTC